MDIHKKIDFDSKKPVDFDFMIISDMCPDNGNEEYILTRKIPVRLPGNFELNKIEEPEAKAPLKSTNKYPR